MSGNGTKIEQQNKLRLFGIIKRQQKHINIGGGINIMAEFRKALSKCIGLCELSRYQICARMSEILDYEITVNMLNSWTAESHDQHRFPAEFLPALCNVIGSYEPIKVLIERTGHFLMPGEEALRSEIQKIDEDIKKLQDEKEARIVFLKEAEKRFTDPTK